jgi:chromosome partitioning related protein ParA
MKIISVISTKGGVGKTTLIANLAGYLSSIGKSVLMIDADPQPSLSSYYKIEQKAEGGLIDFLSNSDQSDNYISKTQYHNCDLVYSNDSDNQLQSWLANKGDGRFKLKISIKALTKKYDYIFIDTQGAKGSLQDASVLAADILISPILPEMATVKELERGTLSMLSELQSYKEMGINVPNLFGVIYKVDNTKDAKQFVDYLIKSSKDKSYSMLETQIPQSVTFKEATSNQIPVTEFKNWNKKQQTKAQKSINAIVALTQELNL